MKVTQVPVASAPEQAAGVPSAVKAVKMDPAVEGATAATVVATSNRRGPKVLQSRQARQRCLEFPRG